MFQSLRTLEQTLNELEETIGDKRVALDDILIWFEKYVRSVFETSGVTKRGNDLTVPLDTAFNIAIGLFELIDIGSDGIDDRMAEELKKIKVKYLGS